MGPPETWAPPPTVFAKAMVEELRSQMHELLEEPRRLLEELNHRFADASGLEARTEGSSQERRCWSEEGLVIHCGAASGKRDDPAFRREGASCGERNQAESGLREDHALRR